MLNITILVLCYILQCFIDKSTYLSLSQLQKTSFIVLEPYIYAYIHTQVSEYTNTVEDASESWVVTVKYPTFAMRIKYIYTVETQTRLTRNIQLFNGEHHQTKHRAFLPQSIRTQTKHTYIFILCDVCYK